MRNFFLKPFALTPYTLFYTDSDVGIVRKANGVNLYGYVKGAWDVRRDGGGNGHKSGGAYRAARYAEEQGKAVRNIYDGKSTV